MVIYARNSIEHLLVSTTLPTIGGIRLSMNHRLVAEEVAFILDDSDAVAVFVSDDFLPIVEQVRAEAKKVRHWILLGAERRPWAAHLDDLIASGRSAPMQLDAPAVIGSIGYTGGTTGRPKGAIRRALRSPIHGRHLPGT